MPCWRPNAGPCPFHCALHQGLDISKAMLDVAAEREVEGDLCLHDLGHGLPIRPGMVDGAISISAVQWLCNAVRRAAARGRNHGLRSALGHCSARMPA